MKVDSFFRLAALQTASFVIATLASAQGPLTPPGPPGPTMKTLAQVEPRIPVEARNPPGDADSLIRITQPGSYYLTTNIIGVAGMSGIEIAANGVSIDFMGFELVGVPGSLDGVRASTSGLTLRNGTLRNWGGNGVDVLSLAIDDTRQLLVNLRVANNGGNGIRGGHGMDITGCIITGNTSNGIIAATRLTVADCRLRANGATGNGARGIQAGNNARISHCTVTGSESIGIETGDNSLVAGCVSDDNTVGIRTGASSTVHQCVTTGNQGGIDVGDGSTVTACIVRGNNGAGISAGNGCTIVDCSVRANLSMGITTATGSTVSRCTAFNNSGDGIRVEDSCFVLHNNCSNNGAGASTGSGIYAVGAANRIEGNTVISNDRGIQVQGTGNFIIGNSANGSSIANYAIAANNKVGTIVVAPNSGAIVGDAGGAGVGSTSPWANFTF